MGHIDRAAFARVFGEWMQQGLPSLAGQQIASMARACAAAVMDSSRRCTPDEPFATQARLVVGVQAVADKSNEIKAIPELLAQLELAGAVVTIDAMGCQKSVAQVIVNKLDWLAAKPEWAGLKAVVKSSREAAGKAAVNSSVQRRYYLCSLTNPERIAQA